MSSTQNRQTSQNEHDSVAKENSHHMSIQPSTLTTGVTGLFSHIVISAWQIGVRPGRDFNTQSHWSQPVLGTIRQEQRARFSPPHKSSCIRRNQYNHQCFVHRDDVCARERTVIELKPMPLRRTGPRTRSVVGAVRNSLFFLL